MRIYFTPLLPLCLLALAPIVFAQQYTPHPFLDSSFSSWHGFSVTETGVQKLTSKFLQNLGIPVDDIDPRTIRIYGRGGQMLPLKAAANTETLHENALWVVGEEDGKFDPEDYILFMGDVGDTWSKESLTFVNLYHTTANYYITYGSSLGKRVLFVPTNASTNTDAQDAVTFQTHHEEDLYNLGALGRRWFGTRFTDEQKESFDLITPNVKESTAIDVVARVAAVSNTKSSFTLKSGSNHATGHMRSFEGTIVATEPAQRFDGLSGTIHLQATAAVEINCELSFSANGNFSANGYLDFIFAQYKRKLLGTGGDFIFTLDPNESVQQLMVAEVTPETAIWELGDQAIVHIAPEEANSFWTDVLVDTANNRFFLATSYKTPTSSRKIRKINPSTDLQRIASGTPIDYLLITSEEFREEGLRLVNHRKLKGMAAELITVEEIYHAFSTGQQDIAAIRNFVRYIYHSQGKNLKYLCMFGDTSYDYQNRLRANDTVVPTFHSLSSFSLANSFMSDDFFTMMDQNEGLMGYGDQMDMAVGRMVFSNSTEARTVVDKVIAYEDPRNKGSWNNSFTLLSDDADKTSEKDDYNIQVALDRLGDVLASEKPFLNITKLHADAFKQVASAGGDRYPDLERALENRLAQGSLVVNYFGHGNEDGLASEFIVDKDLAARAFHPGRFPLMITSTCEFSRFDNPARKTGGELFYQNPTGGAVALISTTRQIYVSNGINYNNILSKYLFSFGDTAYTSAAEALRQAKSEFTGTAQKRIVFFIGDPALKLHIPMPELRLTHKDNILIDSLSSDQKQLKALDKVALTGAVYDTSGATQNDFNGTITVQVFDKDVSRTTLGNDQAGRKFPYTEIGNQIFQGAASVTNGTFTTEFTIPKDISLELGNVRITFIAFNEDKSVTLGGRSSDFTIGGINTTVSLDNNGPLIDVYLNDRSFMDGDKVYDSPLLIVDLADENGINTAGGIGHDITAVLDDNQLDPYLLNAYYTTELDDFTKGSLSFPLQNLPKGEHTLSIKAWDTHNNPSTKTISFWVMDNNEIQIEEIYNTPNPLVNQTSFLIRHNRPQELLTAKIYIFTMDGKRIWHNEQEVYSTSYLLEDLHWDATSYDGQKVNKGTYLYTIELISALSQSKDEFSGKLIVR
jgi:hypothetical protein